MLNRTATSYRATGRAGFSGLVASVFLAACASAPQTGEMTPELRDDTAITSRQIAVSVGLNGQLGWEGRQVARNELAELMRDAALGSTPLVLVVVPASEEVMYGDVMDVMSMASRYGIEARLANKSGAGQ
ncbi:MAG: hypothetical protein QM773_16335 [Hyphomonadaceae bacterium]